MNEHREFYRMKLDSSGILILPSGEIPFQLKDLSIEGFQAHFDRVPPSLTSKAVVRIRLPALGIEKTATVMRIAMVPQGGFTVGFLFGTTANHHDPAVVSGANRSDDHHREFFRKKVETTGYLLLPSGKESFQVRDLSVQGFQAHFEREPSYLILKELVRVSLPSLGLERDATVLRVMASPEGGFTVGFHFE